MTEADIPGEEELAKVIYEAVPARTQSGDRLLSWDEIKTLMGYPYPIIVEGHYKEAKAVRAYLLLRATVGTDVPEGRAA